MELTKITGEMFPPTPNEKSKATLSVPKKEEAPEDDYGEEFYDEEDLKEDTMKRSIVASNSATEKSELVTPSNPPPLSKLAETNYSDDYENEFENEAESQPPPPAISSPAKKETIISEIKSTPTSVADVGQIDRSEENMIKASSVANEDNDDDQYGNDEFDEFED